MFRTSFGSFDGDSWEALCQRVFKRKYHAEQYQEIKASPGDFGLEGVTLLSGKGFQCYCPEKQYTRDELYAKQRDKITADLGKLKTYQVEIGRVLGGRMIRTWAFVTPEIDKNELMSHARAKEQAVRSWGLPFIPPDFTVLLHDGGDYVVEINEIRVAAGEAMVFEEAADTSGDASRVLNQYESNILRKSERRLAGKAETLNYPDLVARLREQTTASFLEADGYFRQIEARAPELFARLIRLIDEYEKYVVEISTTWTGSAEELTLKVREGLQERVQRELGAVFGETNASRVARVVVARWIAICELDYG